MKKIITFLIINFLIIVSSSNFISEVTSSFSDIIYVDHNGESDYNNIQDAINMANDGDVIFVKEGIYFENLIIDKMIYLTGENKNNTILNCPYDGEHVGIFIGDGFEGISDVTVSGFTVIGGNQKGVGIAIYVGCNNITVEDCLTHSLWEGIVVKRSCSNVIIRDCVAYNNSWRGGIALTEWNCSNIEISGCECSNNSYGIYISNAFNCTFKGRRSFFFRHYLTVRNPFVNC